MVKKRYSKISKSSKNSLLRKSMPFSLRSQGHVEFMISFVLFISAVLLLFIFINPIGKTESKTKIQENAKNIIIENMSGTVGRLDIFAKKNPYCYQFELGLYGNKFYANYEDVSIGGGKFVRNYVLYFSPYLIDNQTGYWANGCTNQNNDKKFDLGAYSRDEFILKNKTFELKRSYEQDYKGTKKSLGISNEFAFTFKYKDGRVAEDMSVSRNTSENIEKYSAEYPVRVMDERANIVEMIINIRLW